MFFRLLVFICAICSALFGFSPSCRAQGGTSVHNLINCRDIVAKITPEGAPEELREILENYGIISRFFRPSGGEGPLRAYIQELARERGYSTDVDAKGNLTVTIPGRGPTVAFQGHMDMVLAHKNLSKREEVEKFFENGVPSLALKNGWQYEDGHVDPGVWLHSENMENNNGLDNGIGLSILMALIKNPPADRPNIKLIFTVEEEIGLVGAGEYEVPADIDYIVNLDSDSLENITVGCLGSCRITARTRDLRSVDVPASMVPLKLAIKGLQGGHSGETIHEGRANSAKISARLVEYLLERFPRLGVNKMGAGDPKSLNVIPSQFELVVLIPPEELEALKSSLQSFNQQVRQTYKSSENPAAIHITSERVRLNSFQAIRTEDLRNITELIKQTPNGVITKGEGPRFTNGMDLSSNLGWLSVEPDGNGYTAQWGLMSRAFTESALNDFERDHRAFLRTAPLDITVMVPSRSSPWLESENSQLVGAVQKAASQLGFGSLGISSAAGGLELSHFARRAPKKIPMVSLGANMKSFHEPTERVELQSWEKLYKLVRELITGPYLR